MKTKRSHLVCLLLLLTSMLSTLIVTSALAQTPEEVIEELIENLELSSHHRFEDRLITLLDRALEILDDGDKEEAIALLRFYTMIVHFNSRRFLITHPEVSQIKELTVSITEESNTDPQPIQWLSDWGKRIKIMIDHNDVDSNLTNFPILVHLSNSSGRFNSNLTLIFDELQSDSNRMKIAVTTDSNFTQCYVEIEKWDTINKQAWLWVKVPNVSNSNDTILYLYYDIEQGDNTEYIGDTNSISAENVWNSNFIFVSHMRDDPDTSYVRDSTSNSYDGTKTSANNPPVTSGAISDAQAFDGIDDIVTNTITHNIGTGDFT